MPESVPGGFANPAPMVASPKDPHDSAPRRWLILPDQLDRDGWLARLAAGTGARAGAVLVESREWLSRRPYHRQRVAIILLNLRAFADELQAAGVDVRLLRTERPIAEAVRSEATGVGPLDVLEPAEREMRAELSEMIESGDLRVHPNPQWITRDSDFAAAKGREGWRMDAFYRAVRRRTGLLMEDGQPVGGKLSFDVDNRARWDGIPAAPEPPRFLGRRCGMPSSARSPRSTRPTPAGSTSRRSRPPTMTRACSGSGACVPACRTSVPSRTR